MKSKPVIDKVMENVVAPMTMIESLDSNSVFRVL